MELFKKILEIRSKVGVLHFTRWAIIQTKYFGLFIHRINEADKDLHLHNHPWNFFSVIFKGSYLEESMNWPWWPKYPKPVNRFKIKKFLTFSKMNRKGFHKVYEIKKGPVYSLFFTYGQHNSWYYMVDGEKIESNLYRELKSKNQWDRKYYTDTKQPIQPIQIVNHVNGCPCLYTTPCHQFCTCVNGGSSFGCNRCASYGSIEQKQNKSKKLASKIDIS